MRQKIAIMPNYLINQCGKIYSTMRGGERELKQTTHNLGYKRVGLQISGKQKHFYVHRLVAETFIPNPKNKPFINHIDGNKTNNCVDNLEWCTHKENIIHAIKYGLKRPNYGETNGLAKLTWVKVEQIRHIYNIQKTPMYVLGKIFGVSGTTIYNIIKNKTWKVENKVY